MGSVLKLLQNSPCFLRNVVEQTTRTFLELFLNCSKMFLYASRTFIERYMGLISERCSTVVLEKLKCLF